ncbi:acyl-CoA dehydrogenase family protein [Robbsia andropogonis]|uniref:acyl-CoA dehydrogenase family protein n=1 Tax=Robbsia andropogonis TaxID=28092 RepID=UPI001F2777D2|nr:acyl-CoA dehydrogenase family protein [Robbsia andropogonis]
MTELFPADGAPALTTERGRHIRARVAELVPLIRKHALEGEKLGALPDPTVAALTEAGVFKLTTPVELGGYALGIRDVVDIVSEVGRADGAAGWMAFVAGGTRNLLPFPAQAVEEVFAERDSWVGPLAAGASVFRPRSAMHVVSTVVSWSRVSGILVAAASMRAGPLSVLNSRMPKTTGGAVWCCSSVINMRFSMTGTSWACGVRPATALPRGRRFSSRNTVSSTWLTWVRAWTHCVASTRAWPTAWICEV